MGGRRLLHGNYFTRYLFGSLAVIWIAEYAAACQYGIPRHRNPNWMWSWWLEKQNQIKNGEIPANTPGYAMVKWNNEAEQRWLKTLNVEAMNEEFARRREAYYKGHGHGHQGH